MVLPTTKELETILELLRKFNYADTEETLILDIANHNHQNLLPELFGDHEPSDPQPEAPTHEKSHKSSSDHSSKPQSSSSGTGSRREEREREKEADTDHDRPVPPLLSKQWQHSGRDEWRDEEDLGYRSIPLDRQLLLSQLRDAKESEEAHASTRPTTATEDPVDPINPQKTPRQSASGTETKIEKHMNPAKNEEDEQKERFEVFYLKIFHRRLHTGFEDTKDFPIRHNDIVAGRYQIVGYIGSAAFSKAVQCVDLVTGSLVCLKVIKNNKDYFDQSLDEVKLIKYINAHDPHDSNHVLQMYDFFYFKEHLFIVCELLRENLYEFSKYNRESDEENYFTMGRLQRITSQVLIALAYIHSLRLIHCDLKPENILIQSYSRCLVRVIDFGSSCFTTDHLSSYVQSRSYRAPEVILGLPYDGRIDVWSLGCVLAELFTGQVLFQSDSAQGLLSRIMAVMGAFPSRMLREGRHVATYFTKSGLVYRKGEDGEYEVLQPRSTTLGARLGNPEDKDFVEFLSSMLSLDPSKRPSAKEALEHPWLKKKYPDSLPS